MGRGAAPGLVAVWAVAVLVGSYWVATGPRATPPATPQAVRVTAYTPRGAALTQTIHDRAGLRTLESDLQHLMPLPATEDFTCQADNGSRYRAVFSYSNGRDLVADVRRTGCGEIYLRGPWAATLKWSNPQLLSDLDRLFPPEWQTGF